MACPSRHGGGDRCLTSAGGHDGEAHRGAHGAATGDDRLGKPASAGGELVRQALHRGALNGYNVVRE